MVIQNGIPVEDNTQISIVDTDIKYPYGKVKDAVIYLGGQFYFKNDTTNLVRVRRDGKLRLYRKKSLHVIQLSNGNWALRTDCVQTKDGLILDLSAGEAVKLPNGEYVKKSFTVLIGDEYHLVTDKNIVKCKIGGHHILKTTSIPLDPRYYGEKYVDKKYVNELYVNDETGAYILPGDVIPVLTGSDAVVKHYHTSSGNGPFHTVFYKFRDVTNPQLDRIDTIYMTKQDWAKYAVDLSTKTSITMHCHVSVYEKVVDIYQNQILASKAKEAAELKAALYKAYGYSDDGPDENMAKDVVKIATPFQGNHQIFNPDKKGEFMRSTRFDKTGGLRLNFGVEIETSQGMLPKAIANQYNCSIVGDRSIGSGEYVTAPMQGNVGIECLEGLCNALSKHTLVDNRCSIHVHCKGENDFDARHFSMNAIKLGTQIEAELFASCPPSRAPMMKHCHSILRWKDINDKNWKQYLGAFVFGQEESWTEPFSFAPYKYGDPGQNKEKQFDKWPPGRYKWLNLIHVLSASKMGTFEIRLFAGTTNFHKVYMYVLTTLAFTWFVENRPGRIAKGDVKLREVLTEAFIVHKHPEIAQILLDFYEQRTARFARDLSKLYPATIPAPLI